MMFAPLEGWRHVKVTDRHTAVDYAHVLKELADIHFANAKTIVLVQDNLNIHTPHASGMAPAQVSASSRPFMPPGMITSVNRRLGAQPCSIISMAPRASSGADVGIASRSSAYLFFGLRDKPGSEVRP
jgi:hypothetical protein